MIGEPLPWLHKPPPKDRVQGRRPDHFEFRRMFSLGVILSKECGDAGKRPGPHRGLGRSRSYTLFAAFFGFALETGAGLRRINVLATVERR